MGESLLVRGWLHEEAFHPLPPRFGVTGGCTEEADDGGIAACDDAYLSFGLPADQGPLVDPSQLGGVLLERTEFMLPLLEVLPQGGRVFRIWIGNSPGETDVTNGKTTRFRKCGHLDDPALACGRAPRCAQDYRSKISVPLFDRIDLHADVPAVKAADLALPPPREGSAEVASRIAAAREFQAQRYGRLHVAEALSYRRIAPGR